MSSLKTITSCEVCENPRLVQLLDLGQQPLCDDLSVTANESAQATLYPTIVMGCSNCQTVHQKYQIDKSLLFHEQYHYRAALTKDVLTGMKNLVDAVEKHVGSLKGKSIVDVGCNDGSLLSFFRQKGAVTIGVEPTNAVFEAQDKAHKLYHNFFDETVAQKILREHGQPEIVTFTNVFAHIDDLNGLIENIKLLIGVNTKLVIENHYLGSIIKEAQFDTFYHEHPRTYSLTSFDFIAKRFDFVIEDFSFPKRYNGNVRVIIGSGEECSKTRPFEENFVNEIKNLNGIIVQAKQKLHAFIKPIVEDVGPIPARAFPARASILINCFDLNENYLKAVYEQSQSPKVGHYVPGTKIPIRDEKELINSYDYYPCILNLAWHIHPEIKTQMEINGYRGEVLPIYNPSEYADV